MSYCLLPQAAKYLRLGQPPSAFNFILIIPIANETYFQADMYSKGELCNLITIFVNVPQSIFARNPLYDCSRSSFNVLAQSSLLLFKTEMHSALPLSLSPLPLSFSSASGNKAADTLISLQWNKSLHTLCNVSSCTLSVEKAKALLQCLICIIIFKLEMSTKKNHLSS